MKKTDIIQQVIDKRKAQSYLEIGVENGVCFMPIRVRHKVAVDPKFAITWKSKLKWLVLNPSNWTAAFHETTSDDYFARNPDSRFDVIFVDGLHTYAQSLKDVVNSLKRLNEGGVIFLHDCLPPHRAAAYPTQISQKQAAELGFDGWTPEWCGDVWKTVCFLRSQRKDLRVCVLKGDYGLGVVSRGEPESSLNLSEDALNNMTYEDLSRDTVNLLNLKDEDFVPKLLQSL